MTATMLEPPIMTTTPGTAAREPHRTEGATMPAATDRSPRGDRLDATLDGLSLLVLLGVAGLGAWHSYAALRDVAARVLGAGWLADTAPLLVDALIAGCTIRYVVGVRRGRYLPGWRWGAWGGIVLTVAMNIAAASDPVGTMVHFVPPAVWAYLVEMTAKEALARHLDETGKPVARLPLTEWLFRPVTSARVRGVMQRTGCDVREAKAEVRRMEVAIQALRLALPVEKWTDWRTRRRLTRWIHRGTIPASDVLDVTGLTTSGVDLTQLPTAESLLRSAVAEVLGDRKSTPVTRPAARAVAAARKSGAPRVTAVTSDATSAPDRTSSTAGERATSVSSIGRVVDVRTPVDVPRPASGGTSDRPATGTSGRRQEVDAETTGEVLPRYMGDDEKRAIEAAMRELADEGREVTAPAVRERAGQRVPAVALRTVKSVGNHMRSLTATGG